MCDNLRTNLTSILKKCLKFLFQPLVKNGKFEVTFPLIDKQIDGSNCGLFALGYASVLSDGKSSVDSRFVVNEMRNHYIKCSKEAHFYILSQHLRKPLMFQATNLNFSCFDSKIDFSFYNLI